MKRPLLIIVALLALLSVNAQQISVQEAQLKAQQFFNKTNQTNTRWKRALHKAPVLTLATNRDEFYAFNDQANGGYVVISGDERMPDVLAYSYDGLYDTDNLPCNMQAWMEEYAEQVKYLRAHPEAKVTKRAATERKNVGPLLTCAFDQRSPYNDKCPVVNGAHCLTGCVATAMAQIMHYWQWPKQTTDVIPAYTTRTLGIDMPAQPITNINWNKLNTSTLMLLCGTSVHMNYGLKESDASYTAAARAFTKYFGYDELIEQVRRNDYESGGWEQMIYDELNGGRPVLYSGATKTADEGHAFVMDGYNDGFFHVNWGWGDFVPPSYVQMTRLDGNWLGYTEYHSAIVGIQPAYPDTPSRYAVFDNGVMTFYYDTKKSQRSGIILKKEEWANYKGQITKCVFDPSFVNLPQRDVRVFFEGCSQLESIEGIENLNTLYVPDMSWMFYGCSSLTSIDVSGFKTDNLRDIRSMFSGCSSLTSLDLSGFKTDRVTNMRKMFDGCSNLTNLDVSNFNTSNVTDMSCMFYGCSSLTNLDLSGFKTDKVTDMSYMFSGCSSLTSIDVNKLNTLNVTNMSDMFYGCSSLTSLDLSGFKTDKVTDMSWMFDGCSSLTSLDLSGFNAPNVVNMNHMFDGCSSLTSLNARNFKTSNVTDMSDMFYSCSSLTSLDLSGFKTDKVTDMSWMFGGCSNLTNLNVSSFNTSNVTDMRGMFDDCSKLPKLDISNFKTNKVRNMVRMFSGCSSLRNLDVSKFNTSNVTSMASMFFGCSSLTSIDVSGFKTDKVTSMNGLFYGCSGLTILDLGGFQTANVTDMLFMFRGCECLKFIFVGEGWNTSNVTNGDYMFYGCTELIGGAGTEYKWGKDGLESAHIDGGSKKPGYFTAAVGATLPPVPYTVLNKTTLTIYYDNQIKERNGIGIKAWQSGRFNAALTKVTTVVFDSSMANCTSITSTANWFSSYKNLTSIIGIENLKTDNVTNMRSMFSGCSSLTNIDVSGFKTDKVTDMSDMFSGCSSLTSLDLSGFNTYWVNMANMFKGCSCLTTIYVGEGWNIGYWGSTECMFEGCSKLIGGQGTKFDSSHTDHTYAHIDGGTSNPGYFTDKNALTPYVLLSEENSIVTFYYDNQKENRGGRDINNRYLTTDSNSPYGNATTAVFDVSFAYYHPTNTAYWFQKCASLTTITGMENLKTDNVTDMSNMFSGCYSLKSLDVSGFNTSNVTSMNGMFLGCSNMMELNMNSFNTENVTNMDGMFKRCSNLTDLNLSGFQTDKVTNMAYMFEGCSCLTTIFVGEGWSTGNVENSDSMFDGCSKLIGGKGTKYNSSYTNHTYAHIDDGISNPGYFTDKNALTPYVLLSEGNTVVTFYYDIQKDMRGGIDINNSLLNDSYSPYGSATTAVFDASFADYHPTSTAYWFQKCASLTTITGMENLKTDKVTDMSYMFSGCYGLKSLDISGFNTANVMDMMYMFHTCSNLTTIFVGESWNTDNVKNSVCMFYGCRKLIGGQGTVFNSSYIDHTYARIDGGLFNPGYLTDKNIPKAYIALSEENTVITFYYDNQKENRGGIDINNSSLSLYSKSPYGSATTAIIDASFADYHPTSTAYWFQKCASLTTITGMENLKTDNVTDMSDMFSGCSSLTTIYASEDWSTDNVQKSARMFLDCTKLIGGNGTKYNSSHTDHTYARIDRGSAAPGYFTYKEPVGITELQTMQEIKDIYTLDGKKTNTLQQGLNIIRTKGGKTRKVWVK